MTGSACFAAILLQSDSTAGMQILVGIIMLAGGIAGLVKARLQHARYRTIRSIAPGAPTAATGLVRIRGRVSSEMTLVSPLTATRCCYYRVLVEEDREFPAISGDTSGREGPSWKSIWSEQSQQPFRIAGEGLSPVVRPEGLELDIKPALQREVYSGRQEAGDQALLEYLRRKSPAPFRNFLWKKATGAFFSPEAAASPTVQENLRVAKARLGRKLERDVKRHNYRFFEYCIRPGEEYEMVATMRPEPRQGMALTKDSANGLFLISAGSSSEIDRRQWKLVWSFAGWGAGISLFGLLLLIFR